MNFKHFFIVTFLILCSGCSHEQVRIVDDNGNRVKLNTMVPEFNQEQLERQRRAMEEYGKISKFRQDYDTKVINKVNVNSDDENIIIPGNYPNYIFADRVNDYNSGNDLNDNEIIRTTREPREPRKPASSRILEESEKESKTNKVTNKVTETTIEQNTSTTDSGIKYKLASNNKTKNVVVENNTTNNAIDGVSAKTTSKAPAKVATTATTTTAAVASKSSPKDDDHEIYYIQIGIYGQKKNADAACAKYGKIGNCIMDTYNAKQRINHKVLLGPYKDRKAAEKVLEKVIKTGHYDVYITDKK